MRKITVEIDCEDQFCGGCKEKYYESAFAYLSPESSKYYCERFPGELKFSPDNQGNLVRLPECLAAEVKEKSGELSFGDYVLIEQKRYGAENEMYLYKVIGTSASNECVDVPVQSPATATLHKVKELEPVVSCICCGICETEVLKYRVKDVKPRNIPHE